MNEPGKKIQFGFTQAHIKESCHVCMIYDSEEQRRKIVSEYMAAGIREGELVRYFTDETPPEEIRSWLLDLGVEVPEIEKKGSFSIIEAEKAYCSDGKFEPQEMINRMTTRYELAEKAGYKGSRSCGEMSWVFKGSTDIERLLEYEALLNTVDVTFPHTGMCQYDARLFDGATLFRMLKLHPYMIAHGQIVQNPYYYML